MAPHLLRASAGLSSRDQAIEWHLALHNVSSLTPERRQEFEIWHAIPENTAAYERVKGAVLTLRRGANDPDVIEKSKEVVAIIRRRRHRRQRIIGIAAAAAIVIFSGASLEFANWNFPDFPWKQPLEKTYATAVGQRSSIPLEDGSTISLDTKSEVKVIYDKERAISLTTGQAYFQVRKGDKRPFVVHAADRRIVATGTAFDVRVTQHGMEVSLVEGQVKVTQMSKGSRKALPETTLTLRPGEQLKANLGEMASVSRPVNMQAVTGWTSGSHIFQNTKLADAVGEVNRYLDAPIVLDDPGLSDVTVNGIFATGQAMEFVKMIAEVNAITFHQDASGSIRLKKKAR